MAKMRYMFGGKARLPIVVRAACGGGYRLAAQHSQSLEALLCHIPGLKVVMPATPYDAKGLLISSIRDDNPVIFLEHKKCYTMSGEVPEEPYEVPLGLAEVRGRQRRDHCRYVPTWCTAFAPRPLAQQASRRRSSTRAPSRRWTWTIIGLRKTHRVVVVHEAVKFCGISGEIAAQIAEEAFSSLEAAPVRVGAPFCPVPFSPPLEDAYLPNAQKIVDAVLPMMPAKVTQRVTGQGCWWGRRMPSA
jgi:pyruvate dehydrogenase E1 component beta subunit